MNNKDRLMNLLGLAQRAGKLETGTDFVLRAITAQKARLVVLANDASVNLEKKMSDKSAFYKVPLIAELSTAELSIAVGHKRSVVAVMDSGFAKSITKLMQQD
jgi:ribosomal protein L7Ae-like RNA K-turn-binding protein